MFIMSYMYEKSVIFNILGKHNFIEICNSFGGTHVCIQLLFVIYFVINGCTKRFVWILSKDIM